MSCLENALSEGTAVTQLLPIILTRNGDAVLQKAYLFKKSKKYKFLYDNY